MNSISAIKKALKFYNDPEKAKILTKFFQAYPGGYGEGDSFLGVKVPCQRKVAKKYFKKLTLDDLNTLLNENIHEYRLTAIFMLVLKYE
ncbi:MAG: DNA alkylation repair protein, partial [Spirochaetota bacterium]